MSKFYGIVGYIETEQDPDNPDIWYPTTTERRYYGDVIKNYSRWQTAGKVNDDLNYSNQVSIVADPYAYEHFSAIAYIEMHGAKWKVTGVDEQHPRLILTIGGVWTDGEEE